MNIVNPQGDVGPDRHSTLRAVVSAFRETAVVLIIFGVIVGAMFVVKGSPVRPKVEFAPEVPTKDVSDLENWDRRLMELGENVSTNGGKWRPELTQ